MSEPNPNPPAIAPEPPVPPAWLATNGLEEVAQADTLVTLLGLIPHGRDVAVWRLDRLVCTMLRDGRLFYPWQHPLGR